LFGTLRAITAGLKPDEWVIVNGTQSALPGARVNPHEAPIDAESLQQLESDVVGPLTTQLTPELRTTASFATRTRQP
jgi:hypothetical protein